MINHTAKESALLSFFCDRRYLMILILGMMAGIPASLTASTLQAWFTESGLKLYTIGAVSLLFLPYTLRFLWAPLFDHYQLPGLDKRRSWLILMLFLLSSTTLWMSTLNPNHTTTLLQIQLPTLMLAGFIVAIWASSLEIIINAYQTELFHENEQGLGASLYITGWRLGTILSGALGLILAKFFGWHLTYLLMAGLLLLGGMMAAWAPRPNQSVSRETYLSQRFIEPWQDFFSRIPLKYLLLFALVILTYKLTDALTLALNTTFLLRELNFDLIVLGSVNKTVSISAAILGGIVAGVIINQLTLFRSLIIFGFTQGFAALSYALLAYYGKSMVLLILSAFLENFFSGMGNVALLALIMKLVSSRYAATQIALLSAIAYLTKPLVGPLAAYLVEAFGWTDFYLLCFLISLPSLLFLKMSEKFFEDSWDETKVHPTYS